MPNILHLLAAFLTASLDHAAIENCVNESLTIFAYPIKEVGDGTQPFIGRILLQNLLSRVLPRHNRRGQARMTCCIDHDAENAIPLFLCAACNRETMPVTEQRRALDMANAICAAVERGQGVEPAARV